MRYSKLMGLVLCSFIMAAPLLGCVEAKVESEKALSLLPKDSAFVIVVNMQKVVTTEFYNKVKEDESRLKEYNEFIEKTGIDPQKDIDRIAISLSEHMKGDDDIVALVFGRFDKDKILSSIKEEAEIDVKEYLGKEIYVPSKHKHHECEEEAEHEEEVEKEEKEEEAEDKEEEKCSKESDFGLTFLQDNLLVAGDFDNIKKVVDLHKGKGESVEDNQALMDVIKEANQTDTVWGAGLVPEKIKCKADENPMSKAFATITSVVFSINVEKELDALIKLKADSLENVRNLASAINGFIAMGRMSYAEKPEVMELLDGITIEGIEDMVTITMHVSEELMKWLSEEAAKKES